MTVGKVAPLVIDLTGEDTEDSDEPVDLRCSESLSVEEDDTNYLNDYSLTTTEEYFCSDEDF